MIQPKQIAEALIGQTRPRLALAKVRVCEPENEFIVVAMPVLALEIFFDAFHPFANVPRYCMR